MQLEEQDVSGLVEVEGRIPALVEFEREKRLTIEMLVDAVRRRVRERLWIWRVRERRLEQPRTSRSRFGFTCAYTEPYDSEYHKLDALNLRVLWDIYQ
jgi:hypothetical protein